MCERPREMATEMATGTDAVLTLFTRGFIPPCGFWIWMARVCEFVDRRGGKVKEGNRRGKRQ